VCSGAPTPPQHRHISRTAPDLSAAFAPAPSQPSHSAPSPSRLDLFAPRPPTARDVTATTELLVLVLERDPPFRTTM